MRKYLIYVVLFLFMLQGCSLNIYTNDPKALQNTTTELSRVSTIASTGTTTAPTTSSTMDRPPASLSIKSNEEYDNLVLAARNKQLYQENAKYLLVFKSHEELINFVAVLSKLPIPHVVGAKTVTMRYYPKTQQLKMECVIEQTHFYRFTYILNQNSAEENLKTLSTQNKILEQKVTVNEQGKVTALTQFKVRWEGSQMYRCWIDMDGWLTIFEVRNDDVDLEMKGIKGVWTHMTVEDTLHFPKTILK